MAKVFRPDPPAPVYVAPPPSANPVDNSASAKKIEDAQLEEMRKAKGRSATLATGGQGLTDKANVSSRTLIGV